MMLTVALYVPLFSQDIFYVKAAITHRVTVIFKEGQNRLIHKNGTTFDTVLLFCLVLPEVDSVNLTQTFRLKVLFCTCIPPALLICTCPASLVFPPNTAFCTCNNGINTVLVILYYLVVLIKSR